MKRTSIGLLALTALFASCSSTSQKVKVFAKSNSKIDQEAKTISIVNGGSSETKELVYSGSGPTTLELDDEGKKIKVEVPTSGQFFLNASKDTVVGGQKKYAATGQLPTLSLDDVKKSVDSLELLIQGKNVSAANKNFFILPNTVSKITDNEVATLVAPFHQMTKVETEEGKVPEVYQFFTLNEVRKEIERQKAMLGTSKPEEPSKEKAYGNGGKKS